MSSLETDFQRRLSRKVRAAALERPEIWPEYLRRYSREQFSRLMSLLVGGPITVAGMCIMPWVACGFVLAPLFPNARSIPVPTPQFVLAHLTVVGLFAYGLALAKGNGLFCDTSRLTTCAFQPVSDRQLLRDSLSGWITGGIFFAWLFAPVYIAIEIRATLSIAQILALVLAVVVQGWHYFCLATIGASSVAVPRARRPIMAAASMLFLLPGMGGVFGGFLPPPLQHALAIAVFLTPPGWVHGALAYGIVGGQWWGWLFLVPMAVTSIYGLWWLRRGYRIREVIIGSAGEPMPVFEFGLANEPVAISASRVPTLTADHGDTSPAQSQERTTAVRKAVLSGHALAPLDWNRLGPIERSVAACLNDRERAILEHLYGRRPRWTIAWLIVAAVAAPVLFFMSIGWWRGDFAHANGGFTMMVFVPLLAIAELLVRLLEMEPGQRRTGNLLFPVGMEETLAAVRKVFWLRMLWWLPLLTVVSLAFARAVTTDWIPCLAINLAISIVAPRLWTLIFVRGLLAPAATHPEVIHWRRLLTLILVAVPGFAAFMLLVYFHWLVSLGLLLGMAGSAYVATRYFDWLYRTGLDAGIPELRAKRHANAT